VTAAQAKADELGLIAPVVGHVGDGNFHTLPLIMMDDAEEVARARAFVSWLNDLAISMDGTCTGEHGIGQGKAKYLMGELGEGALTMMAAVKRGVDPFNIFNPGKILLSDV
jgi:D-lactate dehydrogenase (cytochrome)